MTIDLRQKLNALHTVDPNEANGLIDMYVYEGKTQIKVGQVHDACLPAFQKFTGSDNAPFERTGQDGIVFSEHLQSFTARTAALRIAIEEIDNNPDIMGDAPTQYSLDDTRPIPMVKNPLLGISRPYCRKGFNVPTDFANMIVKRADGNILFTVRAEDIGHKDDATGADNYLGQFDMVGGAHTHDDADMQLGADEIHFRSLIKIAEKKVGINSDDIDDMAYLGTVTFQHTRGDFVFHHERHQIFLANVAQDWQPKQFKNGDVKAAFWASPQDAIRILLDQPVHGFSEVKFNNNSRASTIKAFLSPELNIITPESVGQEVYDALQEYYEDPKTTISNDADPVLKAIQARNHQPDDPNPDEGFTPNHDG